MRRIKLGKSETVALDGETITKTISYDERTPKLGRLYTVYVSHDGHVLDSSEELVTRRFVSVKNGWLLDSRTDEVRDLDRKRKLKNFYIEAEVRCTASCILKAETEEEAYVLAKNMAYSELDIDEWIDVDIDTVREIKR